jgi:succinylglutamic semialdehyde dehydrogenase
VNGEQIISVEPATGAQAWVGQVGDVDAAVAHAREAFAGWAGQPLSNRIELMRRFANELRKDAEALATMLARETGKPLWDALGEVESAVARVEISARAYAERCAQRKHDNALQGIIALRHKPHGVMAVIAPASQPVAAAVSRIVPALIGGNTVVFKPSEKAPGCGEMLIACLQRAGVPGTVAQLLIGRGEEGQALALHPGVDGVLFTGSAQIGIGIRRRLAARPDKLVALEMGGNNPLILWDTPKLSEAAVLVVQSAFGGGGQRCTAARRLIVRDTLYEPVIEAVKTLAERIICGAPLDDPAPYMGPMIDGPAADGLTDSFLYLLSHGGKAVKHMVRLREGLPFVSPAIIDVTDVTERPDVELFGPLLQVVRVEDFDSAIAEANNTRYGLAAGLIGGTPNDYNRFWANIRAGVVCWNRPTNAEMPAAPMGGIGLSGNHHPGGYYAVDQCVHPVASAELEQPRAVLGAGFK